MGDFFSFDDNTLDGLKIVMQHARMVIFTYCLKTDEMTVYGTDLKKIDHLSGILHDSYRSSLVFPEDFWKLQEFLEGRLQGPIEIRVKKSQNADYQELSMDALTKNKDGLLIGSMKDLTPERKKEHRWQEQAQRDSLTSLYNNQTGKILISEYLSKKTPFSSCGIMVIDIDFFKNINDNYGHLFGDEVLTTFASFLRTFFRSKDILVRAGGDEFVVFLKEISHQDLLKKSMHFVHMVRKIQFSLPNVRISCSVGVCYLQENIAGFTYEQIFENADWALYQAKIKGRNRYVFCDNLKRFEVNSLSIDTDKTIDTSSPLDSRYLRNDIIATAFELFEKQNSFNAALDLLLQVIGIRFQLDRITVIRTDMQEQTFTRLYQWRKDAASQMSVSNEPVHFTREDFQTLFRSYDEYGTTVLQQHNLEVYSPDAREKLMPEHAQTTLYAAMYCEGRYTGSISYVVCEDERYWSTHDRRQLGELTKIISVHMAKRQAINSYGQASFSTPDYDALTGLLSFARFKEEAERIIVGGYAGSYVMIYTDICGFKYFNQKYGYSAGDQILKEFATFIIEKLPEGVDSYFTRVVADQFLMFLPHSQIDQSTKIVNSLNTSFSHMINTLFPGSNLKLRSGIYPITSECLGASMAIDGANYARRQISENSTETACFFNAEIQKQQNLENQIIGSIDEAMKKEEFKIFYQPKISLDTHKIVGAEALIRWIRPNGTTLTPNAFIPLYEKNGRILDLDYYVLEKTAEFLSHNIKEGLSAFPVSVNVSALHARDDSTIEKYLSVLKKYDLPPSLFQVEITESATVFNYANVHKMFSHFRKEGFTTALDNFGAGFSVMNLIADIPLDVVKLDRIFIEKCLNTERGRFFLKETIHILKGLGFTVLCESVERKDQADFLRESGCDQLQGRLFCMPLPEDEFREMLYE